MSVCSLIRNLPSFSVFFFFFPVRRIYPWLPSYSHRFKWSCFTIKENDSKQPRNFKALIQCFLKLFSKLIPMFSYKQSKCPVKAVWCNEQNKCPVKAVWCSDLKYGCLGLHLSLQVVHHWSNYFCTWGIDGDLYFLLVFLFLSIQRFQQWTKEL